MSKDTIGILKAFKWVNFYSYGGHL